MGKVDSQIINTIKNFKAAVQDKYGIVDIILFGSSVSGHVRKGSDIDLIIVVKNYDKQLVAKLLLEWHENLGIHYPVDFIQCSQKKFYELSKGINIVSQAIKEGIVIA